MKIGILTHYDVHNHGALLQLYALKNILEKYGNEVRALTFRKNYDFLEEGLDVKYDISIKSLFWYLSYMKKIGIPRTVFNYRKKKALDKFRKPLLGEYYSRATGLGAVFVGSDEVFSVEGGINPFFFGVGVPCDNIFSYGACSGPTDISDIKEKHMDCLVSGGLKSFKKISVRDENTRETVFALSGIDAKIVCDPVILYGFAEEQKRLVRKIEKDYLLVYAYDNNMNDESEISAIKEFAKKHNLLIVSAGFYHKWCDRCINVSPIELLGYFKYAKFVVTDTFHGSVISMITNTEFVSKVRGNKNKLADLLKRFELCGRIIEDFKDIDRVLSCRIDYEKVGVIAAECRASSMAYIESCLNQANENGE